MGTTRQSHGTPGRDMWSWSTGLGIAAASGHESTPFRWAWVSGNPAGFETEAGRRALSQRRAGGHWVRGDPVAWSPANGAPGGAVTRELGKDAGGLGRATAGDGYLPRSAGMRASGLAALAAIPPNSHADLQWAMAGMTSGDFHAVGQTYTNTGTK